MPIFLGHMYGWWIEMHFTAGVIILYLNNGIVCLRILFKQKFLFTQYTIDLWNFLLQDVVMATSFDDFKKRFYRFMEGKVGQWPFGTFAFCFKVP